MSVRVCLLLWAEPGAEAKLVDYEDRVLRLIEDHGGRVLQRARTDGRDGAPLEIQILEYPSRDAFDAYLADGRRAALAADRDAAIARTEVLDVELV
ncbi:MAG TPA: DUF1330 domain-containing protein [Solirubrobacteraceae bacterium]